MAPITHRLHHYLSTVKNAFLAVPASVLAPKRTVGVIEVQIGNCFPDIMNFIGGKGYLIINQCSGLADKKKEKKKNLNLPY